MHKIALGALLIGSLLTGETRPPNSGPITLHSSLDPAKKAAPLWSILICTLDERSELFTQLCAKLCKQIAEINAQDTVEIVYCKDNRNYSVGFKRNLLIEQAQGEYVCFLDDDDEIHDQYVAMILEKLHKRPDCVNLIGVITTDGQDPHYFIHSARYHSYFTHEGVYYRPPNHLNPMKKSIASQVKFPDLVYGEDFNWTMKIHDLGLFNYEEEVTVPYYWYRYDGKYDNPRR